MLKSKQITSPLSLTGQTRHQQKVLKTCKTQHRQMVCMSTISWGATASKIWIVQPLSKSEGENCVSVVYQTFFLPGGKSERLYTPAVLFTEDVEASIRNRRPEAARDSSAAKKMNATIAVTNEVWSDLCWNVTKLQKQMRTLRRKQTTRMMRQKHSVVLWFGFDAFWMGAAWTRGGPSPTA